MFLFSVLLACISIFQYYIKVINLINSLYSLLDTRRLTLLSFKTVNDNQSNHDSKDRNMNIKQNENDNLTF